MIGLFCVVLTVILVVLKLMGMITFISWWWVFIPVVAPVVFLLGNVTPHLLSNIKRKGDTNENIL